jgi:hypothetical protein
MFIEMTFNLPLGFNDEAQTQPVTGRCCDCTDYE